MKALRVEGTDSENESVAKKANKKVIDGPKGQIMEIIFDSK